MPQRIEKEPLILLLIGNPKSAAGCWSKWICDGTFSIVMGMNCDRFLSWVEISRQALINNVRHFKTHIGAGVKLLESRAGRHTPSQRLLYEWPRSYYPLNVGYPSKPIP